MGDVVWEKEEMQLSTTHNKIMSPRKQNKTDYASEVSRAAKNKNKSVPPVVSRGNRPGTWTPGSRVPTLLVRLCDLRLTRGGFSASFAVFRVSTTVWRQSKLEINIANVAF